MRKINLPFIFMIKVYKFFISPFFYGSCKFETSCSDYALECFKKYNLVKAFFKTLFRIISCNPWFQLSDYSKQTDKRKN